MLLLLYPSSFSAVHQPAHQADFRVQYLAQRYYTQLVELLDQENPRVYPSSPLALTSKTRKKRAIVTLVGPIRTYGSEENPL